MNYWLMKSEPDEFSIDDLKTRPHQIEPWGGIRNYQVRNMLRDDFKKGDLAFFYHSSCKVPAVVGVMEICSDAKPDPSQFEQKSSYFDPKSLPDNPRWLLVEVKYLRHFKNPVTLKQLKQNQFLLESDFPIIRKGFRLSVCAVTKQQWQCIEALEQ